MDVRTAQLQKIRKLPRIKKRHTWKPCANFVHFSKHLLCGFKLCSSGVKVTYSYTQTVPSISRRIIFLETVAGVPGMVAAMMRHMMSLRRMQRDHGWIHTLLGKLPRIALNILTCSGITQDPATSRSYQLAYLHGLGSVFLSTL